MSQKCLSLEELLDSSDGSYFGDDGDHDDGTEHPHLSELLGTRIGSDNSTSALLLSYYAGATFCAAATLTENFMHDKGKS